MSQKSLLLPRAIRRARQQHGWTQTELAQRLSVSQSTISFWERGIEQPSLSHQVQLVTLLPDVFEALAAEELNIVARLYRLERAVYDGKCRCTGCGCAG